ncbi:MAG: hypothetical protein WAN12_16320 [Candidatus Acidiferrum sp.]
MRPSTLHKHIRNSVHRVVSNRYGRGMRFVLESGGGEGFLRDLLAMEMHTHGYGLSRELRKGHHIVDLVLYQHGRIYIEAKQLRLKDRARYAKNLVNDLKRHPKRHCLGVVYLLDERHSLFEIKRQLAHGANRKATCEVSDFISELGEFFPRIYPTNEKQALVRGFKWAGQLDLYAFVVERA